MYRDVGSLVSLAALDALRAAIAPGPLVRRVFLSLTFLVAGGLAAPATAQAERAHGQASPAERWTMAPPAPDFVPPPAGELRRLTREIDSGSLDRDALRRARRDRALIYATTGRHGLAVRELGELIRQDRNDPVAHFALGLTNLQRPGDAVRSFNEVVRLRGDIHDGYRARAWAHLANGSYRNAVRDFDRVLQLHPEDVDALRGRAWAQLHDRRFDGAVRDFTELHRRTRHPDAMLGRGLAHHYRGRARDAREDFRSAMRYRARAIPTYAYGGRVLDDWRRNRRVAEVLNRETRGRSASVDTWLAWGTLSHRSGDIPAGTNSGYGYSGPAMNAFDLAVDAAPGDDDVLLFRALAYTRFNHRSHIERALADLGTIIQRDPRHVEAHLRRALILGTDGNTLSAAIVDAERALELSGNDPAVAQIVAFLHDRQAQPSRLPLRLPRPRPGATPTATGPPPSGWASWPRGSSPTVPRIPRPWPRTTNASRRISSTTPSSTCADAIAPGPGPLVAESVRPARPRTGSMGSPP